MTTDFSNAALNSAFSGLNVNDSENIEAVAEMLEKFKLRWTVSKQKLILPNGTETGFFGIVRDDKQTTFSTCKDSYTPFQNSELGELVLRIADKEGYDLHSGGALNGGGKVFIQLNTHNEITNLGENKTTVKGYVTGINSHDGTTSLKWGAANITICCRNTFMAAAKMLQYTARHTTSMHAKIEDSLKGIYGIQQAEKSLFDQFIKLSEVPVTKENIARIVKDITAVNIMETDAKAKEQYSTYAINRSGELLQSISSEMKQKGQTLWGLFSGVTHYTSHKMPVPNRENARIESQYTGTALQYNNVAFNYLAEAIN